MIPKPKITWIPFITHQKHQNYNIYNFSYCIVHFVVDWGALHGQLNRKETMLHKQIIRLFGDQPVDVSPFSIHRLVRIGVDHGKRPGDWYGPASVAYVLRYLIHFLLVHKCIEI